MSLIAQIQRVFIKNLRKTNLPTVSSTRNFAKSYEGDGKTKVHIMNDDSELGLMINGYSQMGFRLNNDMTILGPMAIFPRTVLSWNVGSYKDINEDALSLFTILEPKLDIVVLGTGDQTNDTTLFQTVIKFMRKHKLNIEILPTEQAVSTFNFLNSEGRYCGGAFIPPEKIRTSEDDLLRSKLKYQKLYELDD